MAAGMAGSVGSSGAGAKKAEGAESDRNGAGAGSGAGLVTGGELSFAAAKGSMSAFLASEERCGLLS